MDSNLHLNPVHSDLVKQFLDLTHYQLAQRIKSVRHSFSNLLTFKIRDNASYESGQVREMLIGLQEIVIDEIENELTDSTYTSTLLIQKLLKTAEEWHLTLNTTIADLEDRDKLNAIKQYDEELRRSPAQMTVTIVNNDGWSSSNGDGTGDSTKSIAHVLKEKVTQLTVQNQFMKSKIEDLEFQLREATIEDESSNNDNGNSNDSATGKRKTKSAATLYAELKSAQKEIQSLKARLDQLSHSKDDDLESIQESVVIMKRELEASRQLAETQTEQLRHDLEMREDKLRTVQSHLLLKEKELEQKFQATQAYLNMKKILLQKNSTIKDLRQKLVKSGYKFGTNTGNQEDDEEK